MPMSSRSLVRVIAFGGSRGPLVVISAVGYVMQLLAFQDYYAHSGGDGWRELGPGFSTERGNSTCPWVGRAWGADRPVVVEKLL